jgi:hypothetical protein
VLWIERETIIRNRQLIVRSKAHEDVIVRAALWEGEEGRAHGSGGIASMEWDSKDLKNGLTTKTGG